jgi:hypothetical protein
MQLPIKCINPHILKCLLIIYVCIIASKKIYVCIIEQKLMCV